MKKRLTQLMATAIAVWVALVAPAHATEDEWCADDKYAFVATEFLVKSELVDAFKDDCLRDPASMTKWATALEVWMAIEREELSIDQKVLVKSDFHGNFAHEVKKWVTVDQALHMMAKWSDNGVARTLGRLVVNHGRYKNLTGEYHKTLDLEFAAMLNKTAADLGMVKTHYYNADGMNISKFSIRNRTTAREFNDQLLSHIAIPYKDQVLRYFSNQVQPKVHGIKISHISGHLNSLPVWVQAAVKTGTTTSAGYNLSKIEYLLGGRVKVSTLMGMRSKAERDKQANMIDQVSYNEIVGQKHQAWLNNHVAATFSFANTNGISLRKVQAVTQNISTYKEDNNYGTVQGEDIVFSAALPQMVAQPKLSWWESLVDSFTNPPAKMHETVIALPEVPESFTVSNIPLWQADKLCRLMEVAECDQAITSQQQPPQDVVSKDPFIGKKLNQFNWLFAANL